MTEWRALSWLSNYEISEDGDLRHTDPVKPGHRKGQVIIGSWKSGYRTYWLLNRQFYAHRLVCEAFHGPPPVGRFNCAHYDGNPSNNHYTNLRWASQKENAADAIRHGTIARGSRSGTAKLTEDQATEIRSLVSSGMAHWRIAQQFGCSRENVRRIAAGIQWAHLGGDVRPPRKKEFCKYGHKLTEPRPKNRSCRICDAQRQRIYQQKKRQECGLPADWRLM